MKRRLVLIDGNNLAMRAYFSTIQSGLTRKDGTPSGALFGAIRMTHRFLEKYDPAYMVWCFDQGASAMRLGMLPEYKGHRKVAAKQDQPNPAKDLPPQYAAFRKYLDAIGVAHHSEEGVEADDIIATAAYRWALKAR